jgi:hypothetical protein
MSMSTPGASLKNHRWWSPKGSAGRCECVARPRGVFQGAATSGTTKTTTKNGKMGLAKEWI